MRHFKTSRARMLVSVAVVVAAGIAYALHFEAGTPSAFGIDRFFLLCPLGGLEAVLADKLFVPQVLISLAVVAVAALFSGRAWCAWVCPAQIVRGIAGFKQKGERKTPVAASFKQTFVQDSRLWVLVGVLVATVVVGFPVFCLVCPIGLTFGTVVSVVRLIQANDASIGLLVYPIALVIELIVMKKWCLRICPIAGLLSLAGRVGKGFRPSVDRSLCRKEAGQECDACKLACPEGIDLHAEDAAAQIADCTRCAECKAVCPASAVSLPVLPKKR